jgi:hypothetical protein
MAGVVRRAFRGLVCLCGRSCFRGDSSAVPTWLKLVHTAGADFDERSAEIVR